MQSDHSIRRTASLATVTGTLSLVAVLSTPTARAMSSYLNTWSSTYPGSGSGDSAGCQLCHASSTQNLNPYGEALCSSGAGSIGNRIRAVEAVDSDVDPTAASNIAEINAGTQPGWTPGNVNPTYSRSNCNPTGNVEAPPAFPGNNLDPAAGNQPPVANANGPYSGTVGIPLDFSSNGSTDPDGNIVAWDWNFGDGASAIGPAPGHTYQSAGTFTVTLTVTDDGGDTGTATTSATIGLGNQPPVADANGPYSGMVGEAIAFSSSGSDDPDGSITAFDWDFGDGSTGSGPAPSHSYGAPGTYNVTLTVTDDHDATDSAAATATVTAQPVNQPPVADASGPYSGMVGTPVSFNGSGSSDADGDIVQYDWDFGDGNTGNGVTASHSYSVDGNFTVTLTVTDNDSASDSATTTASIGADNLPPLAEPGGPYSGTTGAAVSFDGSASSDPDGSITAFDWDFGDGMTGSGMNPAHSYSADGNYTVTLTVTDDAGDTGSATATASIGTGNLPPLADAGGPYSGTAGLPVSFDGSAASDPDGVIVSYDWDFGDGSSGSGMSPAHAYSAAGTYHATLQVTDDSGATDSALTTVDVAPQPGADADVSLQRLQAPRNVNGRTGRTQSQNILAIGGADGMPQDASVGLAVNSPTGVTVAISPDSVTQVVTPGERTRYRFRANITCDAAGSYVLDWTATISAAENSNPGNDSLTAATSLSCGNSSRGGAHPDRDDHQANVPDVEADGHARD